MGEEITYKADINTGYTAATKVTSRSNHLVDEFTRIRLKTQHHLEVMRPALRVLSSRALDANVRTAVVAHLLELAGDALALAEGREVEGIDVGILRLDVFEAPVLVDHDDAGGAVDEREVCGHLADRSSAPDGDDVALLYAGIDDSVPAGGEDVGEEETLLIGDIVGEGEEIHVAVGNACVFGLAAGEATGEVGVAEHAGGAATVHGVFDGVGVCLFALGGELLLAVVAFTAGDLEGGYYTLSVKKLDVVQLRNERFKHTLSEGS